MSKARKQPERHLVKRLRDKLLSRRLFSRIEIHRKPSASSRVREHLHHQLGYVPLLQPELDMVLWSNDKSKLFAVEVKVLDPSVDGKWPSFYAGIGQALALHRLGFDGVALWSLFLGDALGPRCMEAWWFVRHDLKLPLDFQAFDVEQVNDDPDNVNIYSVWYDDRQRGHRTLEMDDLQNVRFVYNNPIRDEQVPRAIREALDLWFGGCL